MQFLLKTVWQFLRKLNTELSYDPAFTLLGIYPPQKKTENRYSNTCTRTVTAALLHKRQKVEIQMPIDRRMDQGNVVYTHNRIIFSHKKN